MQYTQEQLINTARFSNEDIEKINQCRRPFNRLGFGYQLSFVGLENRFPSQNPLEIADEILSYVSIQLGIPSEHIDDYSQRRQTVDAHRERIRVYFGLLRYGDAHHDDMKEFIFQEACRLEATRAILANTKRFLIENKILKPSDDTLQRLIAGQRESAKEYIYNRIADALAEDAASRFDSLIETDDTRISQFQESLSIFKDLAELVLDETLDDGVLRTELFRKIDKNELTNQIEAVEVWLSGKYSHVFNLVKKRFSYIRQFSPALLRHLQLIAEGNGNLNLLKAMDLLRLLNDQNKRKLPEEDVPLGFIPKKIRPLVESNGMIDKPGWECALLTAVRDEIKAGNLSVKMSKRFGRFDDFFISDEKWNQRREAFFKRSGLPSNPTSVAGYLTGRLNTSYDRFIKRLSKNTYAKIDENGWRFSSDIQEKLDEQAAKSLERLKSWLSENMRVIKLPELLIEVDNELKITRQFLPASKQDNPRPEEICTVIATIMAHGCNIGPYTMAQLTGISYGKIKNISDWMVTEEVVRSTLAKVVNAISNLDITQMWGQGKTSSSDGQRFSLKRKVLQQTYSPKFRDFAIEFYSFIADNFAPFFSFPIECTDRDAPYVLDGLLYNESDLPLEEHYTDTHGYTENNFAAFAMLGRRFSPRI